ncbi:ESX secretion-associated protein EspG [Lentzea sp. NPDC004789]
MGAVFGEGKIHVSGEIVCSFVELDVLGVALRLDVRQFPFSIPHFAVEAEERLRLGQAAQDALIARGLIRRDDFAPELVQTLNVYTRGRIAIAMRGVADQEQHLALAVIDDHAGVLAVQEGEALRFELTQPDSVMKLTGRGPRRSRRIHMGQRGGLGGALYRERQPILTVAPQDRSVLRPSVVQRQRQLSTTPARCRHARRHPRAWGAGLLATLTTQPGQWQQVLAVALHTGACVRIRRAVPATGSARRGTGGQGA